MSNHGVAWNETPRTVEQLKDMEHGNLTTNHRVKTLLNFIEHGHPRNKNGEVAAHEAAEMADEFAEFRRLFLAVDYRSWKHKAGGNRILWNVAPTPRWLKRRLRPMPWFRLWVRIRGDRFTDWHRDDRQCRWCLQRYPRYNHGMDPRWCPHCNAHDLYGVPSAETVNRVRRRTS